MAAPKAYAPLLLPCHPISTAAALLEGQDTISLLQQLGPTALKTVGGLGLVLLGGRFLMRRCGTGRQGWASRQPELETSRQAASVRLPSSMRLPLGHALQCSRASCRPCAPLLVPASLHTPSYPASAHVSAPSLPVHLPALRVFELVAEARSEETFVALCLLSVTGASLLTQRMGFSDTLGAFAAGVLLSGNVGRRPEGQPGEVGGWEDPRSGGGACWRRSSPAALALSSPFPLPPPPRPPAAETNFKTQVEADIQPFRGILLGLFFVTTGSSMDVRWGLAVLGMASECWAASRHRFGSTCARSPRSFAVPPQDGLTRSSPLPPHLVQPADPAVAAGAGAAGRPAGAQDHGHHGAGPRVWAEPR